MRSASAAMSSSRIDGPTSEPPTGRTTSQSSPSINLPGDIALSILLNFPVWAGGARKVSRGLKDHYGLGLTVEGTDKLDVDVLDRFSQSTQHFLDMAMAIVARDLTSDEAEHRMSQVGRLAVEYEAMVWRSYYSEGVKRA